MAKYPKKPKAPRRSAGLKVWERYDQRVTEWRKKCSSIDSAVKRKEQLIQKLSKI